MNRKLSLIILILILTAGCDQSAKLRRYTEITRLPKASTSANPHGNIFANMDPSMRTQDPSVQKMLADSVAAVDLTWRTPEGWSEQKGSGMRLATLNSMDSDPVQCTLVSLSGISGGIEANVNRWIQQIGLAPLTSEQFGAFMDQQEVLTSEGGLNIQVIDFTSMDESTLNSMVAGIVETSGKTIFIKMTGSLPAVIANREQFRGLCASLKISPNK